jgi:hypothetical protein
MINYLIIHYFDSIKNTMIFPIKNKKNIFTERINANLYLLGLI